MIRRTPLLAATLSALLSVGGALAQPSASDDASTRFKRGVELYEERDFRASILEFRRAYEIKPNFRVLYNIGMAHMELQEYVEAFDTLSRYLAEGGAAVPPDRVVEVNAELEKAKARIARVEISSPVDGATVSIDDVEVGTTPLKEPVRVSVGQRRVTLSKTGYVPVTRAISIAGGDSSRLSLELAPIGGAPKAHEAEGARLPGTPFWVLLATTGAFGIGAGIAGGLAVAQKSSHDELLETQGAPLDDIQVSASELRQRTIATDVLLGATGASAVLTIVLAFTTTSRPPPSKGQAQLRPLIGATFAGLEGSF